MFKVIVTILDIDAYYIEEESGVEYETIVNAIEDNEKPHFCAAAKILYCVYKARNRLPIYEDRPFLSVLYQSILNDFFDEPFGYKSMAIPGRTRYAWRGKFTQCPKENKRHM